MRRNATGVKMMVYFSRDSDGESLTPFSCLSLLLAGKTSPALIEMAVCSGELYGVEGKKFPGWLQALSSTRAGLRCSERRRCRDHPQKSPPGPGISSFILPALFLGTVRELRMIWEDVHPSSLPVADPCSVCTFRVGIETSLNVPPNPNQIGSVIP